jgi:AAA domain
MKLAISGTYSSGKTSTVFALSRLTGIPRTTARTMREILPDAVPGKTLAQCTSAEFVQLVVCRHADRVKHEALLGDRFVSDGSSLQEWSYGTARVVYGIDPSASVGQRAVEQTAEMRYFNEVFAQLGHAFKRHVAGAFDAVAHLRHELPLVNDGHRPMNDKFRSTADQMLLDTFAEIGLPCHMISGSARNRLRSIVDLFGLPTVMSVDEAIELARQDYARQDLRLETERALASA